MNNVHYDWPTESPPRRRWPKRLLWSGLSLLVVVIVGTYARVKLSQYNAQKELDAIVAELDETDPGWRLDDIEAARKVIPDEENSALVMMQIVAKMPKPTRANPPIRNPPKSWDERVSESSPEEVLEPDINWELRKELESIQPLLKQARGLALMNQGRYPITYAPDILSTSLQHVQQARDVAYLLRKDVLVRAREEDIEGALESAQASVVVGRSIGDEPMVVSQLVRMACDNAAANNLERTLAQGEASEPALSRFQRLLAAEEGTSFLVPALRGERGGYDVLLRNVEDGKVSFRQIRTAIGEGLSSSFEETLESLTASSEALRAHPVVLRMHSEAIKIAEMPTEQQLDLFNAQHQLARSSEPPRLARLLFPAARKWAESDIRTHATLRCAIAALAAERFRLANKCWPKDLQELVPTYLKQVPLDPYDGKPLRMRMVEDGLAIYSIGPDLQDNGGVINRRQPLAPGTDIVFRLWNVADRRKPALNPDVGPPQLSEEERQQLEAEVEAARWMMPQRDEKQPPRQKRQEQE
jgi:hypothetical protein